MFPTIGLSKALTLGGYVNVRVLRDHAKREAFAAAEQTRQALRLHWPTPTQPSNALQTQFELPR